MTTMLLVVLIMSIAVFCRWLLRHGLRKVPSSQVGIVVKNLGFRDSRDQFQVRVHGSLGVQATTLQPDRLYLLPPPLYSVKCVPKVHVPAGTIGLVVAKDGAHPPCTRTLCRHVQCDYFQDGAAFLLGGGQKGRQLAVLPGDASYAINTELFRVLTADSVRPERDNVTVEALREVVIPEGATGVVVVHEGRPAPASGDVAPHVEGHQSFQLPWEFLNNGGQRGTQAETLGRGGVYRINPWFARVLIIPTRMLLFRWGQVHRPPGDRMVAASAAIRIHVEGHPVRCAMAQAVQIPAGTAPRLVSRLGEPAAGRFGQSSATTIRSLYAFLERLLKNTVEECLQGVATTYTVTELMNSRTQVRAQVEAHVREALRPWGLDVGHTTLHEFVPEDDRIHALQRKRAAQRELREVLEYEHQTARQQAEIEDIHIETARRRAQLGTAELERQIELLGGDVAARQLLIRELAQMQVPQLVGAADPGSLPYHASTALAWRLAEWPVQEAATQAGHPYQLIRRRSNNRAPLATFHRVDPKIPRTKR